MHRIKSGEDQAIWMYPVVHKALDVKWADESNKKIITQNKIKIMPPRPMGHSTLASPFNSR